MREKKKEKKGEIKRDKDERLWRREKKKKPKTESWRKTLENESTS